VPYTGAWCDRHYRRILLFHPRGAIGCFVWLAIACAVVAGVIVLWTLS
jgi:hypothetical protein